jgi:hypothetical protein
MRRLGHPAVGRVFIRGKRPTKSMRFTGSKKLRKGKKRQDTTSVVPQAHPQEIE